MVQLASPVFHYAARLRRGFAALVGVAATLAAAQTPATPRTTAEGFAVPQPGHVFTFPRDHGSHPEFKIEWWYLTGHLFAADGRRFGFQATFFRQAAPDRSQHLHLAHMALIDVQTKRFLHQERLNRTGWDANTAEATLDLHNGPWSLRLTDPATERLQLEGGIHADARFSFTLTPAKPLVVFGENSVSRKGAAPTAASYYLTFSRLNLTGQLQLGSATDPRAAPETLAVTGQAWMDHEISSSQLDTDQVGWDWVSVQLKDGREFMLYRLRRRDGSADPASTLQWVNANGRPTKAPYTWTVDTQWKSPHTTSVYPSRVRLATTPPGEPAEQVYTLEPLAADQELPGKLGGVPYWEGACRVLDARGNEVGSAYMELTGYAKDLKI